MGGPYRSRGEITKPSTWHNIRLFARWVRRRHPNTLRNVGRSILAAVLIVVGVCATSAFLGGLAWLIGHSFFDACQVTNAEDLFRLGAVVIGVIFLVTIIIGGAVAVWEGLTYRWAIYQTQWERIKKQEVSDNG